MLLPTPIDERQSPLRSPIRRKRLRKRLRRRKLRRRARRTWHTSHASWPPHASADYIVDHSRQDIAGISAARLVERLGERKVNTQTLPRVISMPLPPLRQAKPSAALEPKTRPLYHQPAWISPELHTWLVQSGLFATKPRHELLSLEL
ncbi:hypothetical protein PHYSODRAFT_490818 [Phytophthora sojae]|uniref:Uncharacterized protein n=1 Tax=Phytophthora sojae (strain P6497) TaxID=1094619 RepID=G4Z726_PHYSP|nr:hypothetical protein PHYSODRAFT_490818 [Phytophthora sojae]EGZ21778.1 hypothetical protein PHYSODRAFT_490818 [Phytophthora sojae]|eukprot:XP_009524495.1 hypothetical protein PHYSODRAFT_490818 [Phytophthora sojae]